MSAIAASLTSSSAIGLIGRTVTYVDETTRFTPAPSRRSTTAGGKPSLTVGGIDGVDPATITQVA